MKNIMRVLSLIALTGTALTAASNASFAAHRPHIARHKPVAMKPVSTKPATPKRAAKKHKKVVINLERGKGRKTRKVSKAGKKPATSGTIVTQG